MAVPLILLGIRIATPIAKRYLAGKISQRAAVKATQAIKGISPRQLSKLSKQEKLFKKAERIEKDNINYIMKTPIKKLEKQVTKRIKEEGPVTKQQMRHNINLTRDKMKERTSVLEALGGGGSSWQLRDAAARIGAFKKELAKLEKKTILKFSKKK